jgi:hypothetical protein
MTDDKTLEELARRRAAFKTFQDAVDADLARQREERLAAEKGAIRTLILTAAAEGKSMGQIKRAYGTTDHRTIADVVHNGAAEILAIQKGAVAEVDEKPDWFVIHDDEVTVTWQGDLAVYTWTAMESGEFMFTTDASLWDDDFNIKNPAVEVLDGKTESESAEARIIAKFIRKGNG